MSQYYINTFELDTTDLGAVGQTRQIKITGDVGAEFYLQVVKDSNNFYNFETNSFSAGFEPKKNKKVFPDVLIVPLVGFDNKKFRLGYGGGFYDRYINRLKKIKKITIYIFQYLNF